MIYRDGIHNNKVVQAIAPAVQAASGNGNSISLLGFGSCEFLIEGGAVVGAGNFSVVIQDAPDNAGSPGAWTPVPVGNLQFGSEYADPIAADTVERIGYVGAQPWVRATLVKNSGTSIAVGAVAVLGYPEQRPVV